MPAEHPPDPPTRERERERAVHEQARSRLRALVDAARVMAAYAGGGLMEEEAAAANQLGAALVGFDLDACLAALDPTAPPIAPKEAPHGALRKLREALEEAADSLEWVARHPKYEADQLRLYARSRAIVAREALACSSPKEADLGAVHELQDVLDAAYAVTADESGPLVMALGRALLAYAKEHVDD